ncbi:MULTISPECIES: transposase [unclassified Streptomyces]|uniref:transposase n=1 Tax=unclassified Streptomyces TaxID=2593676 RepID=UPI0038652320
MTSAFTTWLWVVKADLRLGRVSVSLREPGLGVIPVETERVARAVCPDGTLAMRLRDEFADVFSGEAFVSLFPRRGRPAVPPGALALVTVLQFAEGLSDRQAATAVRMRIDWKYALGLELTDTGFDYSVLSEFRARLVQGQMADELFEQVLQAAKERGLLKTSGRARTDSARVLAAIRVVNHLEMLGETLRAALNALAAAFPQWLAAQADEAWFDRYGHRFAGLGIGRGCVVGGEVMLGVEGGGACADGGDRPAPAPLLRRRHRRPSPFRRRNSPRAPV